MPIILYIPFNEYEASDALRQGAEEWRDEAIELGDPEIPIVVNHSVNAGALEDFIYAGSDDLKIYVLGHGIPEEYMKYLCEHRGVLGSYVASCEDEPSDFLSMAEIAQRMVSDGLASEEGVHVNIHFVFCDAAVENGEQARDMAREFRKSLPEHLRIDSNIDYCFYEGISLETPTMRAYNNDGEDVGLFEAHADFLSENEKLEDDVLLYNQEIVDQGRAEVIYDSDGETIIGYFDPNGEIEDRVFFNQTNDLTFYFTAIDGMSDQKAVHSELEYDIDRPSVLDC